MNDYNKLSFSKSFKRSGTGQGESPCPFNEWVPYKISFTRRMSLWLSGNSLKMLLGGFYLRFGLILEGCGRILNDIPLGMSPQI
jgi:hypothetical protein